MINVSSVSLLKCLLRSRVWVILIIIFLVCGLKYRYLFFLTLKISIYLLLFFLFIISLILSSFLIWFSFYLLVYFCEFSCDYDSFLVEFKIEQTEIIRKLERVKMNNVGLLRKSALEILFRYGFGPWHMMPQETTILLASRLLFILRSSFHSHFLIYNSFFFLCFSFVFINSYLFF